MAIQLMQIVEHGQAVALVVLGLANGPGVEGHPDRLVDAVPPFAIVGSVPLADRNAPDFHRFARNKTFVDFYAAYMRGELAGKPGILAAGHGAPGTVFAVVDRRPNADAGDVRDVIGWYRTDADGRLIPGSFETNPGHLVVSERGFSSIVTDGEFEQAVIARILAEAAGK